MKKEFTETTILFASTLKWSFLATIIGIAVAYFYNSIKFNFVFSELLLIKVIIAGVFFGIVSLFLIETMRLTKNISSRMKISKQLKGLIGGLILIVLTLIFSNQYLGLGLETIKSALEGEEIIIYAFLLKIIFTSITLNFGGSGGVITPIFFIGATAGVVFANLTGMDRATFAAIGLVSVLSGATNTPIASSIMAIELFGTGIVHYAALSCIISFLITGHRSIYPSQILGMKKSSSIEVEIGKEADEVNPRFQQKKISFVDAIFSSSKSLKEKIYKNKKQ